MLHVETSTDGQTWARTGERFRSKAEAQTWFDARYKTPNTYEWRIGFLVLTPRPEHKFFRIVHPNGKVVRG